MSNGLAFQPIRRSGLRHDLVNHILKAIFQGHLRSGHRLVVQKLAAQFGVSATPAREALLELTTIGVVEMMPNRGAVVRPFGASQLSEIYQLRRILETEATRCACGRLDRDELEKLRQTMTSLGSAKGGPRWSTKAMDADRKLHEMIALGCSNQRLCDEICRYNTLVQAAREVVDDEHSAQQRAIVEHLEVLSALIDNDPDVAAAAMSNHILNTAQIVAAAMFPVGSQTA
jgi:DNA-binding GntR family transcriptional regulator